MTAYWRNQFIALEKAKQEDLHPDAEFNAKLDFLTTAVGFDPMKDDYFYPLLTFQDPYDKRCFAYPDWIFAFDIEENLPKRFFVRCGAVTKINGYPADAKYNWRVFDDEGRARYLTPAECNLFGLDYYDGTTPEGLVFEKNLQSDIYKKFSWRHRHFCQAIWEQKINLSADELHIRSMRWKSEWRYTYNKYLCSEEWQDKRKHRLYIDCGMCTKCGKNSEQATLQAHHLTYKNVGDEDVYQDLVILCSHCHTIEHGKENRS